MRRTIGTFGVLAVLTACTSGAADRTASPAPTRTSNSPSASSPAPSSPETSTPSPASSTPAAGRLPLGYRVGGARQVITVVAASHSSTTATLRAWQRGNSGWARVGPAVPAWLGSGGIGRTDEGSTATPAGSFTVTQAFGRDADPGTALPYRHTTPADWWISQRGPLYNTEQHCSSDCRFTPGEPNEHLYYATPYYDYAVVIDYNRFPVHQGAGSAFFLHVTVHEPTQGCVSIDRNELVRIMRWLDPRQHPRILMGVG